MFGRSHRALWCSSSHLPLQGWKLQLWHDFARQRNQSRKSQFYIQLVNRPQFGTWILLFGPFGQLRAAEKKVDLSFSEQLLRVVFSTFCGQKIFFLIFEKYFSVRIEKLYKMAFNFFLTSKSWKNRLPLNFFWV